MKKDTETVKDKELWERLTKSVKPLPGKKRPLAPTSQRLAKQPNRNEKPSMARSFAAETKENISESRKNNKPNQDLDRATFTKLRKGKMVPEARLDLHGMREEQAYQSFARFIASSKASGLRCLLVITGKGKSPNSSGALRRALPLWIESARFSSLILAYSPAARKDGGDGAWYILLRRTKNRLSQN